MIPALEDHVAVVTGANGGIGHATSALLHARGACVALLDLEVNQPAESTDSWSGGAPSRSYAVDITDREAVDATITDIQRDLGPPTVLVNSVGWLGPTDRAVWQYTATEWQAVFEVNLNGPMNCVQAVLPGMLQAAPGSCHIVNVASMGGMWAERRVGAYSAAKHALVAYTETLEAELETTAPTIGVSLVCPEAVPTNLNYEFRNTNRSRHSDNSREWRQSSEVAEQIVCSIEKGTFYVFTHQSTEERYRAYISRIFAAFRLHGP